MGLSSSPAQFTAKLDKLASDMRDTRRPLNAAALAAKSAMIGAEGGLAGSRVARGKVGVRYDIRRDTAVVRWFGPAHLVLNATRSHRIEPRRRGRRGGRRRALTIGSDFVAWANHPGTSGKDPGAARGKAAAAVAAPRAYQQVGLVEPLRRIF